MRGSFVANRASARRTILAMGFLIAALPACGGGGGSGASEVGAAEQFGVGPLAYEYGDEDLPVASAEEVADLFPATELFVDGTISIVPTDDEAPIAIPKGRRVGAPPLPFSVPRLPGDETLEGIAFDPTRNGVPAAFVTSAGRLFLYDARGDSWSVKRTEPAQALRGIAAFKRGEQLELVAAGTFGRAWYSPDAGASWTQKSMPTPGHLNVVATCPMGDGSPAQLNLAGEDGDLIQAGFDLEGAVRMRVNHAPVNFNAMTASAMSGILGGDGGTVARSECCGHPVEQSEVPNYEIFGFARWEHEVFWAFGEQGVILRSGDFGHTWTVSSVEQFPMMVSGVATSARQLWLFGDDLTSIVYTEDGRNFHPYPTPVEPQEYWRDLEDFIAVAPPGPISARTLGQVGEFREELLGTKEFDLWELEDRGIDIDELLVGFAQVARYGVEVAAESSAGIRSRGSLAPRRGDPSYLLIPAGYPLDDLERLQDQMHASNLDRAGSEEVLERNKELAWDVLLAAAVPEVRLDPAGSSDSFSARDALGVTAPEVRGGDPSRPVPVPPPETPVPLDRLQ